MLPEEYFSVAHTESTETPCPVLTMTLQLVPYSMLPSTI
jgi:hypothetical protein